VPIKIIPFLKCCLSDAEDGTQDDILWNDSEHSGDGAASSANESVTEGSVDEHSD
jgi:hypothetical protein